MSTVWIVILTYIKPLEEVDAVIPSHVEWLKKCIQRGYFWHWVDGAQEPMESYSLNVRVWSLSKNACVRFLFRH